MNPTPFILGSYVLAIGGTFALGLWSFLAMRRDEKAAEAVRQER